MHSQFWWVHPRGSPDWRHPTLCPLAIPDRQHMTGVNHWIRWHKTERLNMPHLVSPGETWQTAWQVSITESGPTRLNMSHCVPWWHLTDSKTGVNHQVMQHMSEHVPPRVSWQHLTDRTWEVSIIESGDTWLNTSCPVSPDSTAMCQSLNQVIHDWTCPNAWTMARPDKQHTMTRVNQATHKWTRPNLWHPAKNQSRESRIFICPLLTQEIWITVTKQSTQTDK